MRGQILARIVLVSGLFALVPSASWGQTVQSGAIAGTVKDASGRVLPGVTVEAASPVLIEKARTVVSDGRGIYRLVELRPGPYTVTFSLAGFNQLRREGIDVSVGLAALVNVELPAAAAGARETITIVGPAPMADAQTIIQQNLLEGDVRIATPMPSNTGATVTVIAAGRQAAANQDVGGVMPENRQQFTAHGTRTNDFQQLRDGYFYGTMVAAGNYMTSLNPTVVRQTNTLVGGGLTAESESGGAQVNNVYKDGGSLLSGTILASFSDGSLQTDNLDAALNARNASTPPKIKTLYEVAAGVGGPIMRDKLWFFGSTRRWITSSYQPGLFFNKLQGTMFYEPDLDRPAYELGFYNEGTARLTWKPVEKHRITGMYSVERNCNCFFGIQSGTMAPEATGDDYYWPNWRNQVTWSYPATNRLLFEAGHTIVWGKFNRRLTGSTYDDISITDLNRNFIYNSSGYNVAGITQAWGYRTFGQANQKFSMSYVTGSHALKTGVMYRLMPTADTKLFINGNMAYRFRGRVPQEVVFFAGPYETEARQSTVGLFAQDQWTLRRLTLNLGLRFDQLKGWIPARHLPAGDFRPAADFEEISDALNWKDLSPRLGAGYDLFGNGRTVVKAFIGRFVGFQGSGGLNVALDPVARIITSSTRVWTDANGDYIPQENELGPHSAVNLGQLRPATDYDRDVTHGFGNRDYNWQTSVSFQHELRRGLLVDVSYFRTWYGNFLVTDNLAVTPADFDPYCITAPADSRLPNGGEPVCGLYDVTPAKFGQIDNVVTFASEFGKQSEVYNGVDITMTARFGRGGTLAGGVSIGRTVTDACFVVDSPQGLRFCNITPPWSSGTQLKFSGSYPIIWDFRASLSYQNIPSIPLTASYVAGNALIAPSLGRNLAAGARGTATIDLIQPQSLYREGRNQQLNLRLSRRFQVKGARVEPQLDLFNILNGNSVLTQNTRYGARWQDAQVVLAPRMIKLGVRVDF